MNQNWQQHTVYTRPDDSYVITCNDLPFHVPADLSEFADLWLEVDAFAKTNPEQVMPEPGPAEPSLDERKAVKRQEIKSGYNAALIATLTMPEAAPSPSETAVQAALFAVEDSAGLSDVLAILNARRAELETAVESGQTVAEVQGIVVTYPV